MPGTIVSFIVLTSTAPESSKTQAAPLPQDRWSQIRSAHLQNKGKMTSWDVLRSRGMQGHRNDVSETEESSKRELTEDQRRAMEQAEFDAMLEAERKKASGS